MMNEMPMKDVEYDFAHSTNAITQWTSQLLADLGVSHDWINFANLLLILSISLITVFALKKLISYALIFIFKRVHKVTRLSLFEYGIKEKFPHYIGLLIASSFLMSVIPIIFDDFKLFVKPCVKTVNIYIIYITIKTIMSVFKALTDLLQEKPAFARKPFQSYLQVVQIVLFIIGLVGVYSIITGNSATAFFAAMGAASAVLMLMFKDTIMGFVASIQISSNNMAHVGDWITMSKYGADGTVEEINLTTVKVRNFDKTTTTIPTYSLISDSFQNWRGTQDSGTRRFMRALIVKQSCIHYLESEELEKYKKMPRMAQFIEEKQTRYDELNKALNYDSSLPLYGHRLTNCDLFMHYATCYLQNHPRVNADMPLMVRHLDPTTQGLPIQIYVFLHTNQTAEYEDMMGEIFNHLLSAVRYFDLVLFESTSGTDSLNVILTQNTISK